MKKIFLILSKVCLLILMSTSLQASHPVMWVDREEEINQVIASQLCMTSGVTVAKHLKYEIPDKTLRRKAYLNLSYYLLKWQYYGLISIDEVMGFSLYENLLYASVAQARSQNCVCGLEDLLYANCP